jgi:Domain of unknown function (DUF6431)
MEQELRAGRLACPACGGRLGPWGRARGRWLRVRGGEVPELEWLVPRRSRCRGCGKTHVVLPDVCLGRRRDAVAVIGVALVARAAGSTHRAIAAELELPPTTVRGWLRRAEERAEAIRAHFTGWGAAVDRSAVAGLRPAGGGLADAVEAIGVAARAVVLELGQPRSPWALASVLTAGWLLGNTSVPWMAPP